jgi:histidine phosphotransferase ChpT
MIPLRVTELLCSRLCHDLISPVAAVSNGLELLGDDAGGMGDDITSLLSLSIGQAAGRLTFYRAAYGLGGDSADALSLDDVSSLVRGLVESDAITAELPSGTDPLGRGPAKLLLNAAALGLETLPKAGRLAVAASGGGGGIEIDIHARGNGVAMRPETVAAIAPDADMEALTPRSVQGYLTAWLARSLGGTADLTANDDGAVRFVVHLPTG